MSRCKEVWGVKVEARSIGKGGKKGKQAGELKEMTFNIAGKGEGVENLRGKSENKKTPLLGVGRAGVRGGATCRRGVPKGPNWDG